MKNEMDSEPTWRHCVPDEAQMRVRVNLDVRIGTGCTDVKLVLRDKLSSLDDGIAVVVVAVVNVAVRHQVCNAIQCRGRFW